MLSRVAVIPMLDREVYLYAEVDRIIGLRNGTARRWINGYERGGKHYEPILRVQSRDTEWATWGEFVEARILAELREEVQTRRLRLAIQALRETFRVDYPLAHLRPYLSAANHELILGGTDVGLDEAKMVVRTGQMLLGDGWPLIERAKLGVDEHGESFVAELPADDEFPDIVINPQRFSGQPTIAGRRIAVATIAGMRKAGESEEDLAGDYGLSIAQVRAAVDYAKKHRVAA
ncbi:MULTISPECIES: DUF433 domain-containing protein [unclassified Mycolicibacterium]|uniref:DUF433 domain-containing protein n=1 Tax=unclassified Mycolicibacterium TaxID=2636767 RepID=UPI0016089C15|nr:MULTISPECIES: DUF433 domain-containing protein [unclassified Mycolicibacterium]